MGLDTLITALIFTAVVTYTIVKHRGKCGKA